MFSAEIYKLVHLSGVLLVILALGGIALHMISGGTRNFPHRKFLASLHGIGLLLALVGGFGLLARLNITSDFPGWVWAKGGLYLLLGAIPTLFYRFPGAAKSLWFGVWIAATAAAWLAIFHPF